MSTLPQDSHDPEDLLARIYSGLRDAQPPIGMQRRILESTRASDCPFAAVPARRRWSSLDRSASMYSVACGIAAVLVPILVLLFVVHPHRQTSPRLATSNTPLIHQSMSPASTLPKASNAQRARPVPSSARLRTASHKPTERVLCDCDPLALAELRAPSHPAPPLPLTAQEQLMLRIIRRGDPTQLAQLDPLQRQAALVRERAQVSKFFNPSTPGDRP
jgi:hypothetical protein